MANYNAEIIVSAIDNASGSFSKISNNLKGIGASAKKFGQGIKNFAGTTLDFAKKAGIAIGAIGTATVLMAKRGGKVLDIQKGFIRGFGKDVEKNLDRLRYAAKGTITDFDLMQSANRSALLGVTKDSGKLAKLLEVARVRGKEMGTTTTQAFNDIVTGIGRTQPLILDNLGIQIPNALKKTMKGMTEAQKKQVLMNAVIKDGQRILKAYKGDTENASDGITRFTTTIANIRDEIAVKMAPAVSRAMDFLADALGSFFESLKRWYSENKDTIDAFVRGIKDGFKKLYEWGKKAWDGIKEAWKLFKEELKKQGVLDKTNSALDQMRGYVDDVVEAIKPFFEWIKKNKKEIIAWTVKIIRFGIFLFKVGVLMARVGVLITKWSYRIGRWLIRGIVSPIRRVIGYFRKMWVQGKKYFYKLMKLFGRTITAKVRLKISGAGKSAINLALGRHAGGGVVRTPYQIVGERGPELVQLPYGSRVHTATETKKILNNSSSKNTYNVSLNINGYNQDPRKLANMIIDKITNLNKIGKYNMF